MPSPTFAAGAYAAAQQLSTGAAGKLLSPGAAAGGTASFADILKDAVASVGEAGRKADAQSVAAAGGKADLVDVATAVAESETALETLVAVRDRVIQAYEDIMRMPI